MGSNDFFSKIIADVFSPWHCVKKNQQTAKTSAFIEVNTLTYDQLIEAFN